MSAGRATSLPMIQVNTPQRMKKQSSLPREITDLLNQVKQLREDTETLICNCNQPDCPFQESHLINVECSFDLNNQESPRLRRKGILRDERPLSLTSLKGIEKRSDGTIVERDGPRSISREDSLEKRLMRSYMYSNTSSYGLGKFLSVSTISDSQDCLVDNDNLFGTSSDDDSTFSRFEATRRHIKRNNSRSPNQKRRATLIPSSNSFPASHLPRKTSVHTTRPPSRYLRNAASLPSCAYFEDDEQSLSTCSSSSSLSTSQHMPCHTSYPPQNNELLVSP